MPPEFTVEFMDLPSAEALYALYWKNGRTLEEIARESGVCVSTIAKRFREFNIPTRSHSQRVRLAVRNGAWQRPVRTADEQREILARHAQKVAANLALGRQAGIRRRRSTGQRVRCYWCGCLIYRQPSRLGKVFYGCTCEHSALGREWVKKRFDEPRPLILARLRELAGEERNPERLRRMAAEIGASDIEVAEILFPSETAV